MADPFQKLRAGDVFDSVPHEAWNGFIDASNDYRQRVNGARSSTLYGRYPTGIVPVRNDSGADCARFEILSITGVIYDQATLPDDFYNQPTLTADTPGTAPEKFVILQEPIADGEVGRGMLMGITAVQVSVGHASDEFADVISGDSTKLRSGPFGSAKIHYKPSGTGTKWCYVEPGIHTSFRVRCVLNGSILQDATGSASVYRRTGATTYSDTTIDITVLNDLDVDLGSGAVCEAVSEHDGSTTRWRIVNADYTCP